MLMTPDSIRGSIQGTILQYNAGIVVRFDKMRFNF